MPLLIASRDAHDAVRIWAAGRSLALSEHARIETYADPLPGNAPLSAGDADRLVDQNFPGDVKLPPDMALDVIAGYPT